MIKSQFSRPGVIHQMVFLTNRAVCTALHEPFGTQAEYHIRHCKPTAPLAKWMSVRKKIRLGKLLEELFLVHERERRI
jgi:hypothetical protein